jgi:hypothetical protein
MKYFTSVILLMVWVMFNSTYAGFDSEHRIALLIGNNDYSKTPGYENLNGSPYKDVESMRKLLQKAGFTVYELLDGDKQTMKTSIEFFAEQIITQETVSLFYFSGHGSEFIDSSKDEDSEDGDHSKKAQTPYSYLVPVNKSMRCRKNDCNTPNTENYLGLTEIFDIYKEHAINDKNIMIFDSCRNEGGKNTKGGQKIIQPLKVKHKSSNGDQKIVKPNPGINKGTLPPSGTVLLFAVPSGKTTFSGKNNKELSSYTSRLLDAMQPGIPFTSIVRNLDEASVAADLPSSHSYGGERSDVTFGNFFLFPRTGSGCGWGGC